MAHSFRAWEIQDEGNCRLSVWWGLHSLWQVKSHCILIWVLFDRTLILVKMSLSLWCNCLSKTLLIPSELWGFGLTFKFREDTDIQTTALSESSASAAGSQPHPSQLPVPSPSTVTWLSSVYWMNYLSSQEDTHNLKKFHLYPLTTYDFSVYPWWPVFFPQQSLQLGNRE
jgi:hypothetical protein